MENGNKRKLTEQYEVVLMVISVLFIGAMVVGLTAFPEEGKAVAASVLGFLTGTFGSTMQFITVGIIIFLIALAFSKYGDIRLGNEKPQYSTMSWVAMMFFCGNGAGTVYWAFLEWGWHFNAAPQLGGVEISEAMNYELAMAYTFFDWGPSAWALLCVFVLPFAYHYYIKKDNELRFSRLCKYAVGEKATKGFFGKVVDFIFVFAAVGSIAITAGTSATTIADGISSLTGLESNFTMATTILLCVAVLYSISSLVGIEKGMRRISDWNVYFCLALLGFILIFGGYTQFIIDSIVNALGVLTTEYARMSLWTDPVAQSGYPQAWTTFYLVYWFTFGPFTGLFVAKISKGRKIKEIIANMLISGSAGLVLFFGIVGGFQQGLRMDGILDVPAMLANGQGPAIATETIRSLPLSSIAMVVYLVVIILFLATTLDACSFTLSSTITKDFQPNAEPNKGLKFIWCIVLVGLPIAVSYIGTDIDTIKAIVLTSGLPLVVILGIIYYGFLREMKNDFGNKTKDEILQMGRLEE
ncbi:BCCT family transporter [Chakrabartyella piscis]|uniref:BCCT family transporter n=1 Tax=Chakrabartyella piscis TaxID=2918914 RepID=UPI0029588D58|nr:BCCT family transporter [Chakrabartyella piscis]